MHEHFEFGENMFDPKSSPPLHAAIMVRQGLVRGLTDAAGPGGSRCMLLTVNKESANESRASKDAVGSRKEVVLAI